MSILTKLQDAIDSRGAAYLAISGGSSPRDMFEFFGHAQISPAFPWGKLHLFWVDERMVPPTDSQSNYKLANDTWLAPAKFPAANVHRVITELGPEGAAERYADEIRSCVRPNTPVPRFDVIHRGMGPDGHTASLFPGEPLIADKGGVAAAVWVEKMHQWRVTLLPGVLEAARSTVMLVTGADKAQMLKTVLTASYDATQYPAQIASLKAEAEWFVDAAAQP